MNFGYVFDEGFTVPAAVSIFSLLYNNRDLDEINLFILDDGIAEESRIKLERMVSKFGRTVSFIDVKEVKSLLSKTTAFNWNGSYSTYIRLMLNTLLPNLNEVIIMIDGDTIVNGSISGLSGLDLNGNPCAMALEAMPYCYHKYSGLGNHELINGGLLLIDLKKWREIKAEERILFFLKKKREKNMLTDEDVLSIVFKGQITRISLKYNYLTQYYLYATSFYYKFFGWDKLAKEGAFYSLKELKETRKTAIVFHCIDTFTNRPWHKNNIHPYTKLFDMYLKHTPWKNYEKPNRMLKIGNKIELLLRRILPRCLSRLLYASAVKLYYGIGAKQYYKSVK